MRRRMAVVAVASAVLGSLLTASPAAAAEVTVRAVDFAFEPDPVQVEAGDTITWANEDPEPHTITADDGSFSLVVDPGESVSRTFADDGTIPYFCKLHGAPGGDGMAGTIQVGSVEPPPTVRLVGADNVARSIAWSTFDHPDGAGFALIGRSDGFADSLASGSAQGQLGGPLLLTASNALDARVKAELDRLGAKIVYLLGGTGAVSPAVADELTSAGYTVRRVAGSDRLATAVAVADTFVPGATSAILVRAFAGGGDPTRAFVDSLGAGALAALNGEPVLFSDTGGLSATTKAYLESHPISQVTVVGGTAALSDKVVEDLEALDIEVGRIAGLNRADTARTIAFSFPHEQPLDFVLVDGSNPNAWADGFAAAGHGSQILLTAGDGIPGATAQHLGFEDEHTRIICGTTVTATGCNRSEVVRGLDLDLPAIAAYLDDEERGGLEGAAGASGLYVGEDGTTVCYDYFGTPLDITAAHVHAQADGAPVIPMLIEPAADNDAFGCTFGVIASTLADVVANPGDYYVNIHTAEFPDGAVSGTLTNLDVLGFAGLLSESEVPGPGDPDAVGFAFVFATDTPGELCVALFAFGFGTEPTAAHIHEGASGATGPPVLTLRTPTEEAPPIGCYEAGETLIGNIRTTPSNFYINVHTTAHPDGAIRGQITPLS